MRGKQYAVLFAFLIMLIAPKVYAETVAEYTVEYGGYDTQTHVYTAEVYLNTKEYLSAGSFGMQYDALLALEFSLDEDNFTYFQQFNPDSNYVAFQWYLNDIAPTGKIHMGTVTVKNVIPDSSGKPRNWHKKTFRQLDWLTTNTSQESEYTLSQDGVCLNDEIWRSVTDNPDTDGFYQGCDMADKQNPKWVDIGFSFDSGYNLPDREGAAVSGTVQSYNPNNPVAVTLYAKDTGNAESTFEQKDYTKIYSDGRVICGYEFTSVPDGEYTLKIQKDAHLTYSCDVSVKNGEDAGKDKITLYCGDITADEKIKQNDRIILLRYLNQQSGNNGDTTAMRSDLDGDGRVTLHDLNILKSYYNRKYKEAV